MLVVGENVPANQKYFFFFVCWAETSNGRLGDLVGGVR